MTTGPPPRPAGARLGVLELLEPLGSGGQGTVYRARHRAHHLELAVKVWRRDAGSDRLLADSFRSEARHAAALDHRNIVSVFDFGLVPRADARDAPHILTAGQPYLVMERLEGRTLTSVARGGATSWPVLRALLRALLDAVAHAHARDVLHRDLKPSNVLVDARSGRVALTDFGIAVALGAPPQTPKLVGSPHFMSPEQILDHWRDFGPSTDLYALGCVAWLLVTGRPPFTGASTEEVLAGHLARPLPDLRPRAAIPAGLDGWLRALLAKRPSDRFECAADAAWHLARLPSAGSAAPVPVAVGADPVPDGATMDETITARSSQVPSLGAAPPASGPRPAPAPCPASAPPSRALRGQLQVHAGLGRGVFGLRVLPLVGRDDERRALWEALREVHDAEGARLALIRGAAGVGKSRIARWLVEAARQTGAATAVRAVHGDPAGARDGLAPMLARELGCAGLAPDRARDRAEGSLAPLDLGDAQRDVLTSMVVEAAGGPLATAVLDDRLAALVAWLRARASRRPLVLWLDDLQWGWEALELTERLLAMPPTPPTPVLVLATVQQEALHERPDVAARLDALGPPAIELAPLGDDERRALVQELLGLDPALAARIEARSGGNPLFAIQLVGDLIERDRLELGRHGFRLREGATEALPADLAALWSGRLRHALGDRSEADRRALELGAVLGHEVAEAEWRAACDVAAQRPADDLVADWMRRRLIVGRDGAARSGWAFVHGMLREALVGRARAGGRLAAHHDACARALGAESDERRGRHLLAAGRAADALAPLRAGAERRWRRDELVPALLAIEAHDRAADALGLGDGDPRRVETELIRLPVLKALGRNEELLERARALRALAEARGDALAARALATAALYEGHAVRMGGSFAGSIPLFEEGERHAEALDDAVLRAECHCALGAAHTDRGDMRRGLGYYERALEAATAADAARLVMIARSGLGIIHLKLGALDEAASHLERGIARLDDGGDRVSAGKLLTVLGELHQVRGDPARAESVYARAIELLSVSGSGWLAMAQYKRAASLASLGRWDEALPPLRDSLVRLERGGALPIVACIELCLAAADGRADRGDSWDRRVDRGLALLERSGFVDTEVVLACELAIRNTRDPERRRRLLEVARGQCAALGPSPVADRIAELSAAQDIP